MSDIWLRTILIVREEIRCRHIGYSFQLAARVLLYAPSHRQDSTYHSLCYTSHGALAETSNSSMGPPHEGSIQRPIAPWANALTTELHLAPMFHWKAHTVLWSSMGFYLVVSGIASRWTGLTMSWDPDSFNQNDPKTAIGLGGGTLTVPCPWASEDLAMTGLVVHTLMGWGYDKI